MALNNNALYRPVRNAWRNALSAREHRAPKTMRAAIDQILIYARIYIQMGHIDSALDTLEIHTHAEELYQELMDDNFIY